MSAWSLRPPGTHAHCETYNNQRGIGGSTITNVDEYASFFWLGEGPVPPPEHI